MKKKLIFLMLLCAIFLGKSLNVYAEEAQFVEDAYINVFMNKRTSADKNTIYYQKGRYFYLVGSDQNAFCVEPEKFFNADEKYQVTNNPYNLNEDQKNRIKLVGYFGYHTYGHDTAKWYAITQLMIWRISDPNGEYYFTDTLNGNRTNKYDNDINEVNNLVDNYLTKPNFSIPEKIKSNRKIELIDTNNVLSHYTTNVGRIEGNKLIINSLEEGIHKIKLTRQEASTGYTPKFYESYNSQNMFTRGDIPKIETEINLNVVNTSLKIKKVNSETKESNDIGKSSLKNTKFGLYDSNKKLVKELIIDATGTCEITDLDFGKYTLKELEAGTGYKINEQVFEITIDAKNPEIEITIENDIIKKQIVLHKTYGENVFVGEANVTFEIYDENNNLVDTVTTDEDGYIKFYLTYGTYTLKQINSKEGYSKVEPIKIIVEDENVLIIELKDYKIKVPNTYTEISFLDLIKQFLLSFVC